jgi:transposase-like protein
MAKRERDRAREQFWRETFSTWQASRLTVREYCQRHQLTETAFHHWRRELRRRDAKSAPRPATPTFVPVRVIPAATLAVEVRCPSGHVVSLPNADAVTLRALFAALAPVPPC